MSRWFEKQKLVKSNEILQWSKNLFKGTPYNIYYFITMDSLINRKDVHYERELYQAK